MKTNLTFRRAASLAALCTSITSLLAVTSAGAADPPHAYSIKEDANVRAGTSTSSAVLGKVFAGETVQLLCQDRGERVRGSDLWDLIQYNVDGTGGLAKTLWLHDNLLDTDSTGPVPGVQQGNCPPIQQTPTPVLESPSEATSTQDPMTQSPTEDNYVQVPEVYLDGPTGEDEEGYASNCVIHTAWNDCAIPSAEKIGTDLRNIPLVGSIPYVPDSIPVGTLHHAVWGVGQLIEQQQVDFLGKYCNWEIDFEYFDTTGAPYRYDPGPRHERCDMQGGRTITPNYDASENVQRSGRGRYFKTGYICAYLVEINNRRITSCTDIFQQ